MSELGSEFTGLPIRELIATPLIATAESQYLLAKNAIDLFDKIGFEVKEGKKKAKTLDFNLQRQIINNGQSSIQNLEVSAPYLGLVPLPSLLIEDVSVEFQMEITATTTSKETNAKEGSVEAGAGWGPFSAKVQGKVSSSRENTRSTNQTAKYNIRVNARQQQQTEGLSKLMDIMASCITPIEAKSK